MNKTDFGCYDKQYLQNLISESTSISEVLKKLGLRGAGENHVKLSKFLKESDFDTSTLVGRKIKKYTNKGISKKRLSEVLVENGSGNSNKLKLRLIREGVKENRCECCGITEWNGKPITMELHHINGNHYDNRLENLIILCPNCHSQTTNFRGRNSDFDRDLSEIAQIGSDAKYQELLKREAERQEEIYQNKIKYGEISLGRRKPKEKKYCQWCGKEITGKGEKYCCPQCVAEANKKGTYTKEDILEKSKTVKSMIQLSKLYGLSDNGILKWIKKYDIVKEVKENFKQKTKPINQYDLNGNFIKAWKDGNGSVGSNPIAPTK